MNPTLSPSQRAVCALSGCFLAAGRKAFPGEPHNGQQKRCNNHWDLHSSLDRPSFIPADSHPYPEGRWTGVFMNFTVREANDLAQARDGYTQNSKWPGLVLLSPLWCRHRTKIANGNSIKADQALRYKSWLSVEKGKNYLIPQTPLW